MRSRSRARAASRRRAAAWARRRGVGSASRSCSRRRRAPPRGHGIEDGGWRAWTARAWTWPTPPRTAPASAVRVRAVARAPFRSSASGLGGERHAHAVRRPPGRLRGRRGDAGPWRGAGAAAGHAVPGGPAVFWARAVASRRGHRRRSAVARQAEPAAATRDGAGGRVLSFDGLRKREGPATRNPWRPGARGRIPAAGRGRR